VQVELQDSRRLGHFFRDDEDMAAAADIAVIVKEAIEASESLIVVCSPRSARSRWVNAEIQHFRKTGRGQNVFAIVVEGEPNSSDPNAECFPPALRSFSQTDAVDGLPIEPLALDVHKEGKSRICARLAAGLLQINFDDLWQRDRRRAVRQQQFWTGAATILAGIFAVLASLAVVFGVEAQANARIASVNELRAKKGEAEAENKSREAQFQRDLAVEAKRLADQTALEREQQRQLATAFAVEADAQRTAATRTLRQLFVTKAWDAVARNDLLLAARYAIGGYRVSAENAEGTRAVLGVAIGLAGELISTIAVPDGESSGSFDAAFGPKGVRILNASIPKRTTSLLDQAGNVLVRLDDVLSPELAELSLDGRWVVLRNEVRSAENGDLIAKLQGVNASDIDAAHFSPDGRRLLTVSKTGTIELWQPSSGKLLRKQQLTLPSDDDDPIIAPWVKYARGGSVVAITFHNTVEVWQSDLSARVAALTIDSENGEGWIAGWAISPDGQHLAFSKMNFGSKENEILFGSVDDDRLESVVTPGSRWERVSDFSADGRTFMTLTNDNTLVSRSAATGAFLGRVAGNQTNLTAVMPPVSDDWVVAGDAAGAARIWNILSGRTIANLVAHVGAVENIWISQSGQRIATSGSDGFVRVWDASSNKPIYSWRSPGAFDLQFSASDRQLLVAGSVSDDCTSDYLRLVEVESGRPLVKFSETLCEPSQSAISADGSLVTAWEATGAVTTWSAVDGNLVWRSSGVPRSGVPGGNRSWYTIGDEHGLRVLRRDDNFVVAILPEEVVADRETAFSDDGNVLLTSSSTGQRVVWSMPEGRNQVVLDMPKRQSWYRIRLAPNGKFVAGTLRDRSGTFIWSVLDGRVVATLGDPAVGHMGDLAFSPDGTRIATGGPGKYLSIWNTADGRLLSRYSAGDDDIWSVSFSHDGKMLAALGSGGGVDVWNVWSLTAPLSELIEYSCNRWLIPSAQKFSQIEVDTDPLLRSEWPGISTDVCATSGH
jgi:WD40 repeat protein